MNTKGKIILSYVILVIIIIMLIIYASNRHEAAQAAKAQAHQNLIAMTDTLKTYRDVNDNLVHEKAAYQLDVEDLKLVNDSLAKVIEDNPNKVVTIIQYKNVYIHDTILIEGDDVIVTGNHYDIPFNYNRDGFKFDAMTSFDFEESVINSKLQIINLSLETSVTASVVEDKEGIKRIEVFSDNKNVHFTQVSGNVLPPDPVGFLDKFGLGVAVGPTVNYDFIDKNFSAGIGITAGFVWKKYHK